jgi:acyl-coenzyme A thioesterase PaaI-like protein
MRFLRRFTAGALPFRRNHKIDTMTRNVLLKLLGGSEAHALGRGVNLWPPFFGAGIRVQRIAPDMKAIDVEMKLRWWNANYVGTHFGGSLFAMTDAFYMLMLMANLGSGYIVWDKAASIRYRKPGRGTVRAEFRLSDAELDNIRAQLGTLPQCEALFKVEVKDEQGTVIAEVDKIVHVRRKDVSSSQYEPRSGDRRPPTG